MCKEWLGATICHRWYGLSKKHFHEKSLLRFIVRRYFLPALCRVFHFSKAVPVGPLPLKLRVCQKYLFSTSYQNYSINLGSDFASKIQNLKRGTFVLAQSENPSDRWGECARQGKCQARSNSPRNPQQNEGRSRFRKKQTNSQVTIWILSFQHIDDAY